MSVEALCVPGRRLDGWSPAPSPWSSALAAADLGDGWREQSVVVGPLAFVALRYAARQPAVDFRRRGGRYQGLKALAVVKAGATVTLTVPAAERRHLSLLYDPGTWKEDNRYRIADGDTAVTFQSCPPAQTPLGADGTQFNGGFLVAGPRCATLKMSTPSGGHRGG
jgi:hypothetical protein